MEIVVLNHVTLDGVMQSPGGPDEDTRDGFDKGGWAATEPDEEIGKALQARMETDEGIVLGRRTYEHFLNYWPKQEPDSPFTKALEQSQKYVASTTLSEPLPWKNSTLLDGDAADGVAELKRGPGKSLVVMGSGVLIQSLMRRNLIDEYLLLIHPVVLGCGRRLFPDGGAPSELNLVDATQSTTGVVIATYEPAVAGPVGIDAEEPALGSGWSP